MSILFNTPEDVDVRPLHTVISGKLADMGNCIYCRSPYFRCKLLKENPDGIVRAISHEINEIFNQFFIDIAELTLENIMVTADTAVPFCPDFFPAILYGGKPLVAVYSIVEEYEITGNVLLFRTFAS